MSIRIVPKLVGVSVTKFKIHNNVPLCGLMKRLMAGHSKWHSIRHKKGAEDAKRAAQFAVVGKQIKAALDHGGNSSTNRALQNALAKAKDLNVSREFIERAISRALSAKAGGVTRYEGVGPCGVSFMITCITDNKNRTAPALRHVFSKYDADLGATNSVAFRQVLDLSNYVRHLAAETLIFQIQEGRADRVLRSR
jgi:hypothetical protein